MRRALLLTILSFSVCFTAAAQAMPASSPTTGSWKVDGNVEGVPVILTCAIVELDRVISGTCTGDDGAAHSVKGKVQEKVMTWTFDSAYQGQPITITLSGTIDTTGLKMTGSIAVDPLQADGVFTAAKQPAGMPALAPKPSPAL